MAYLNTKYSKAINKSRTKINNDLQVEDILPFMRSNLFSLTDEEIIKNETTSIEKTNKFIDILLKKDNECFETFIEVLSDSYEHLYDDLMDSMKNSESRERRLSVSEVGEMLKVSGVPYPNKDYIVRWEKENQIVKALKSSAPDAKKVILIHGSLVCGKTLSVVTALKLAEIFPNRFSNVCWINIGVTNESKLIEKLKTILYKLGEPTDSIGNNIEVYIFKINEILIKKSILLILDDVNSKEIMDYFQLNTTFIVISRLSNISEFSNVEKIEIPSSFTPEECIKFLKYHGFDNSHVNIKVYNNPWELSLICNLMKNNSDYKNRFNGSNNILIKDFEMIIAKFVDSMDPTQKTRFEELVIFDKDDDFSQLVLKKCWQLASNDDSHLKTIDHLRSCNILQQRFMKEYDCNAYSISPKFHDFLNSKYRDYKKTKIKRFIDYYKPANDNWLKYEDKDPFFFLYIGRMCKEIGDEQQLIHYFTDFTFLAVKIYICGISDLLFDYETYRLKTNPEWKLLEKFFMLYNYTLSQQLRLSGKRHELNIRKLLCKIIQLALYEKNDSIIYKNALKTKNKLPSKDFWDWINKQECYKIWEVSHFCDSIVSVDSNEWGILVASKNGRVSMYSFKSGMCLFDVSVSSNSLVMCKFYKPNSFDFIMAEETGQLYHYMTPDIKETIDDDNNNEDSYDDADDEYMDEDLDSTDQKNKRRSSLYDLDLSELRRRFRKMDTKSIINNKIKLKDSPQLSNVTHCYMFQNDIFMLHEIESNHYQMSQFDNEGKKRGHLFTIQFGIEKCIIYNESNCIYFALLPISRDRIVVYDEFNDKEFKSQQTENVINDFQRFKGQNLLAIRNYLYLDDDQEKLLETSKGDIKTFDICPKGEMIAVSVSDLKIQVWRLTENTTEIAYVLHGEFQHVYFTSPTDRLITIDDNILINWELCGFTNSCGDSPAIRSDTQNYLQNFSIHNLHDKYRQCFLAYDCQSHMILLLQTYRNKVQMHKISKSSSNQNMTYEYKAKSKANCYFITQSFILIGFADDGVVIFNSDDFKLMHIANIDRVTKLCCFDDKNNLYLGVYCQLNRQFSILHFNCSDWTKIDETIEESIGDVFISSNSHNIIPWIALLTEDKFLKLVCLASGTNEFRQQCFNFNDLPSIKDVDMICDQSNNNCCVISNDKMLLLKNWDILHQLSPEHHNYNCELKRCKLQPLKLQSTNEYQIAAVVTIEYDVVLFYYNKDKYVISKIDYVKASSLSHSPSLDLKWTQSGNYLIMAYNSDLARWRVPNKRSDNNSQSDICKLPLTTLHTYFDGCNHLYSLYLNDNSSELLAQSQSGETDDNVIVTIDLYGYLYILKKL